MLLISKTQTPDEMVEETISLVFYDYIYIAKVSYKNCNNGNCVTKNAMSMNCFYYFTSDQFVNFFLSET